MGCGMKMSICLMINFILSFSLITCAQDSDSGKDQPSIEDQLHLLVELGPGVHEIQVGEGGQIESFIVVGQARVSTVLGKAKGLEVARNKANLDCSAQLVKWLREEVRIQESSEEETIVLLQGEDNKNGEAAVTTESGKASESTRKRIDSISVGIVRSLQFLHKEVDADGKTLTVVKGWQRKTSESSKELRNSLQSDKQKIGDNSVTGASSAASKASADSQLENESVTSPSAKAFFRKKQEE
jgi:hypothetical protein